MATERELIQLLAKIDPVDVRAVAILKDAAKKLLSGGDAVGDVLACYAQRHPRARPGDKEIKLVKARLKEGYTSEDLCKAIDGCHGSPWHCGKNPGGKLYQSLALIMRDSTHVQEFIEIAEGNGYRGNTVAHATERSLVAANKFLGGH